MKICATVDSSDGIVEVVVHGLPAGVGESVFDKLDGELGRMMSIGTLKAVEVKAGVKVKDVTGNRCNDQMVMKDGKVAFSSTNAGGIAGGLSTRQAIIVRLAVKPTPTIAKNQTLTDPKLSAIMRRDPAIVSRIWPIAGAFTAIVVLDQYISNVAYQEMRRSYEA